MRFRSRSKTVAVVVGVGLALASPSSASAARIVIPKLGLDAPLAANVDDGPKLYYRDGDTTAIAAHRTTHTHPFLHLPRLRRGDTIRVGAVRYEVRRTAVVRPHEVWILNYRGLVLSACHPAGSAAYRFVVFAAVVRQLVRPVAARM